MNRWAPLYLSVLRIVVGVLFALHGAAAFWGFLGGKHSSPDLFAWPSWWGALIQLVCGLLIAAGAVTRPAAIIASGSMAFAYFAYHAGDGLSPLANQGELSALYCWVLLLFAFTGPGPVSVDAALRRVGNGKAAAPTAADREAAASVPD